MAELAAVMMVVSSVASVGATVVGGIAQQGIAEAQAIEQANALTVAKANAMAEKNQLQAANSINQDRQARINERELVNLRRQETKPSVLALVREKQIDDRANANYQTQTRAAALDTDIKNIGAQRRSTLSAGKTAGRLALIGAGAKAAGQVYGFGRDYVSKYG